MSRPCKPRYSFEWRYSDGNQTGTADILAEQCENMQDAMLKVRRRIAKQVRCFPVQVQILSGTLPSILPPKRPRTHRKGRPPLFDGPVEKNCVRIPIALADELRRIGEGSLSLGLVRICRTHFEDPDSHSHPEELTA